MSRYRYLNANPDGNDTTDCTIRAISLLLNKDYDDVYIGLFTEGLVKHLMPTEDVVWSTYLEKNSCQFVRLPSACPYCYTVNDFAKEFNIGRYLVKVDGHVVAVVDGYYYDTWNSGNEVVLYYWRKE